MITLAMTMLIGTTSVFGGATSVQAAPIQDNMSYCEITQGVSENVQDCARGIFSVSYQVIVDNTAIKERQKVHQKLSEQHVKGQNIRKLGSQKIGLRYDMAMVMDI